VAEGSVASCFFLTEHGLYLSFFLAQVTYSFMGQAGPSRAFLSSSSRTHLLLSHAGGHAPWLRAAIWVQELRAIIPSRLQTSKIERPLSLPSLPSNVPIYIYDFLTLELYLCYSDNTHRPHVSCVISSTSELILRPFSVFRRRDTPSLLKYPLFSLPKN
jgi:hypothetical protein